MLPLSARKQPTFAPMSQKASIMSAPFKGIGIGVNEAMTLRAITVALAAA